MLPPPAPHFPCGSLTGGSHHDLSDVPNRMVCAWICHTPLGLPSSTTPSTKTGGRNPGQRKIIRFRVHWTAARPNKESHSEPKAMIYLELPVQPALLLASQSSWKPALIAPRLPA